MRDNGVAKFISATEINRLLFRHHPPTEAMPGEHKGNVAAVCAKAKTPHPADRINGANTVQNQAVGTVLGVAQQQVSNDCWAATLGPKKHTLLARDPQRSFRRSTSNSSN